LSSFNSFQKNCPKKTIAQRKQLPKENYCPKKTIAQRKQLSKENNCPKKTIAQSVGEN
jgi:hypothetical protein